MFDLITKEIGNLPLHEDSKPTVFKWHPKKEKIIAIGYDDGLIVHMNLSGMEVVKLTPTENISVIDLAWDSGEDNLLVSYANGSCCLMTYNE